MTSTINMEVRTDDETVVDQCLSIVEKKCGKGMPDTLPFPQLSGTASSYRKRNITFSTLWH